jgi:ADP-heptose:LPS heptosyltransferase/predicted SAM-dependent methyltransferase
MTWRADGPQGNEAAKICWEIVRYTRGRGLDLGCGPQATFPHFIRVDNLKDSQLFGQHIKPDIRVDTAEDLSVFTTESMDFVFSSHLLEHIEPANVVKTLKEWLRVIKVGGYLVLYLPDEDAYPKCGEPGANPDHKWNVSYVRLIDYLRKAGSWDLVDFQKRGEDEEYSLYFVLQKKHKGQSFSCEQPKPPKTCGVVRYGAYGDLLQASSVLAGLKKQGYHLTLYTSPPGDEVVRHDPHIDCLYLQDKDQVPNAALSTFWAYQAKKYDKWVNLSESVEGTFLAIPGRTLDFMRPAARHQLANRNYLEFQHLMADVPHDPQMHFYPNADERTWAKVERAKTGGFTVVWSLAGSSIHKTWPYLDNILAALMLEFPAVHVVLVGGPAAKLLEQGWENEPRIHKRCGVWSIRQTLAFLEQADLVVGPETGVLNAAAQLPIPKVVFLSHSTDENLTRDWTNTHVLRSLHTKCPGRGDNEAPACHQLHYDWSRCQRGTSTAVEFNGKTESAIAQCQEDISADEAFKVIWHAITWSMEADKPQRLVAL